MRADLVVERHGLDDVQKLALVLVDALDLDVEKRRGVEPDAQPLVDQRRQPLLVGALDRREALAEGRVVGQRVEADELVDVVEEAVADRFADQLGQAADCTGSASGAA